MTASFVLNQRLKMVDISIEVNQLQLSSKQEELERLKEVQKDLREVQSDFYDVEEGCSKPEFTSKNFDGENAKTVAEIREDGVKTSIVSLAEEQIGGAMTDIGKKLRQIMSEISNIETNIISLESQQIELEQQKKEAMKDE
ncbi:DUF5082 family protein [Oceanobacillus sp. J11TS1]|uniref:YwqH-like family protein n=1 Tax=Oceanobacillus sp. J11TS1 TaxID=2807191 RepID=UPI001B139009|nr:DUF5082 family protein [Oceanobacillus sp. J11TS1]GIO24685.1 hypothetical protein J11TS1_32660 [Oceanobacillus sp. J11TS1]